MVTVRDVARHAGVSIGTVDRVLHGRGRVAPETEVRVNEALIALDYRPNLHARNLSQSRTLVVTVLSPAPEHDRGYWELPLRGIDRALSRFTPNNVQVKRVWFDRHNEDSLTDALDYMETIPDGLLVAPVVSRCAQRRLRDFIFTNRIPTVAFDSRLAIEQTKQSPSEDGTKERTATKDDCATESALDDESPSVVFVGQDPYLGGLTAGRFTHMLRRDAPVVASITLGSADAHLLERARGFQAYWRATKQPADVRDVLLDDRDEAGYVHDLVDQLSPLIDQLGAVFVTNAASAAFLSTLRLLGYRSHIPLVGYDLLPQNARLVEEGHIDVIISQKPEEQGYEAMSVLLQKVIYGKLMPAETLMPVEVILAENLPSFTSD